MIRRFRYVIIVLSIALDQLVKYLIRANMEPGQSRDVIGNVFSITYLQNRGAAFSILTGEGVFLVIFSGLAMIVLAVIMEVNKTSPPLFLLPICFLIGGGVGNLIDRVAMGFVTDMFDFHIWPVFNVADIFVVAGCVLLCIYVIKSDNKEKEKTDPTL